MRLALSLAVVVLATAPAMAAQLSCDGVFGIDTSEARMTAEPGRAPHSSRCAPAQARSA